MEFGLMIALRRIYSVLGLMKMPHIISVAASDGNTKCALNTCMRFLLGK